MKILRIFVVGIFIGLAAAASLAGRRTEQLSFRPDRGYVPDKETALTIAVAVLTPIYGKEIIDREKPFQVIEKMGVWIVTGARPSAPGGAAEIRISRQSGQILFLMHYK